MLTNYSGKRKKVKRRPRYFRALLGRGDGKIGRNRRKRTPEGFTSAKNGYNIKGKRDKEGARRVETLGNRGAVFSKR